MSETVYIQEAAMHQVFHSILLDLGFTKARALQCADIFTANSVDGVYTHGVNRFSRFVEYVKKGYVQKDAEPALVHAAGGLEQWHGHSGPGPLNAVQATERAMQLAGQYGIGCVAMAYTNHWMRGGYYGWQAAKKGCIFIGWTNTTANMPTWGAVDNHLGNNPLVMAIPFEGEAIVLDMAMSQFSFGTMEQVAMKGESLPVNGGFDASGNLTNDPSLILASDRAVPVGYWKGAGLSLLLDILATVLSAGLSTANISQQEAEYNVSQVFICIDSSKLHPAASVATIIRNIIADYHQSVAAEGKKIVYPGERVVATRTKNKKEGIPILKKIWDDIQGLNTASA